HGIRIKDGPDGAASLTLPAIHFQARVPPIKSGRKLVHEPSDHLIHLDEILIVRHLQTDPPCDTFHRAVSDVLVPSPSTLRVAKLVPDHVRLFKNVRARLRLHRLIRHSPKR